MDAPPQVEPSLKPGDILLFHGHGFISWAIRRFDESDVDRAAIVLRPETMAEASASGLRHVAIEPAVNGNAFTYVRRLPSGDASMAAAERALSFSTAIAPTNDRTVLLAVLAMTRRLPIGDPTLRRLVCVLLDRASGILDRLRARDRGLLFGSEFVHGCFERADGPSSAIEVRTSSTIGQRAPADGGGTRGEAMLCGWASSIADPLHRTSRLPKEPIEPLIAAFARVDSPNDPIVPRSYVADAAIAEPAKWVDDDQLHACAVRFRDALLRSVVLSGTEPAVSDDPWRAFLQLASFVTPGDLRYSHSLQTVTSLRPAIPAGRRGSRQRTRVEPRDR